MCNAKKMKQPLASPEESIELQSPEERPEVSQETEPESSEQGTILADTSVVADISRTDLNSDSEPEELNPQDVFDEWILGLKKSDRHILATCLFMSVQKRQTVNVMEATQEAASITG